jgi:hypothetical protein
VALAPVRPALVNGYNVAPPVSFASLGLDDARFAIVAAVLWKAHVAGVQHKSGPQALAQVHSIDYKASTYLRHRNLTEIEHPAFA